MGKTRGVDGPFPLNVISAIMIAKEVFSKA
jgi:hypothetical protein